MTTKTSGTKRGNFSTPRHRTKPEKAWMRARPKRPLHGIEAIVPKLVAAVYDEWPLSQVESRRAAWDSYERASFRLFRKVRNSRAALLADVINYALFCVVANKLEIRDKVTARDIAHTDLLAVVERHTEERSLRPEVDVVVRHIRSLKA